MGPEKRRLGGSGPLVSELGLGLGRLPDRHRGPDSRTAIDVVRHAMSVGITVFDTAPSYAGGRSEEVLKEAVKGRRTDVVVCTKFGSWAGHTTDFSVDRIKESVDASLRRLDTDYLDVLLLHSPPAALLEERGDEYSRVLRDLVEVGKLRQYGVSVGSGAELTVAVDRLGSEVVEVRFNAFHQESLAAMQRAAERGVGIVVKMPLESGWLSGKDPRTDGFDEARSRRWSAEEFQQRLSLLQDFNDLLPVGLDVLGAALGFVLSHDCVSTVVPGARSIPQLDALVEAVGKTLPSEVADGIKALDHGFTW